VQEYWLSKFSDDELRQLHELLNRLVADPDPDVADAAADEASSAGT
jgi:hypothetical protein